MFSNIVFYKQNGGYFNNGSFSNENDKCVHQLSKWLQIIAFIT